MENLPNEIIIKVCFYLSSNDIVQLSKVNRILNSIINNWGFWSNLAYNKFKLDKYKFILSPVDRYNHIKKIFDNPYLNFVTALSSHKSKEALILLDYIDLTKLRSNEDAKSPLSYDELLYWPCLYGNIDVVKELLNITRKVKYNHEANNEGVDINNQHNNALVVASERGHDDIVRILLQDKRFDPTYNNNKAFKKATINGKLEVVSIFLNDPRFDPTIDAREILKRTTKKGYYDIVDLLLKDKRIIDSLCPYFVDKIKKKTIQI